MSVQSASPVYICARVLPCMVSACMPQSCSASARSQMTSCSWFHPKRVFTVTGVFTAFTTSRVMSNSSGMFCSMPAPAPLPATFFTGHPKLMSITSGFTCSTIFAASTIDSTSRPYICIPTGRSSSLMVSLRSVAFTDRTRASALTNSVYTIDAPNRLQRCRNPMSVTSSIGARNSGRSPNCMFPMFMLFFVISQLIIFVFSPRISPTDFTDCHRLLVCVCLNLL